jgi:replicative DNA helicase
VNNAVNAPPIDWADVESIRLLGPNPSDEERAEHDHAVAQQIRRRADYEYINLRGREVAQDRRKLELAARAKQEAMTSTRVFDGASFLLAKDETPPAIWGRGDDILWARGEALIIWGPQGVGKTTVAGQLLAGALGILPEVLGLPVVPTKKKVLYLAMDRPKQAKRSLARLFGPEHEAILRERLVIWTGPPPADFAVVPEAMLEMAQTYDADMVFVDSLKDAAVGLSKDEVGAGYNRARQLALSEGVEVVELHHPRKAGENGAKPDGINDMYGSTWIPSGAGSAVLLWGEAGDSLVEFYHRKQPMNTVGPFKIEHDAHSGVSAVQIDDRLDLVALARRCATTGVGAKDAAAVLHDTPNPNDRQTAQARRKLQDLEKKGLLVVRDASTAGGRGNATLWFPAAPPEDIRKEMSLAKTCDRCGCEYMSFDCEIVCFYTDVPLVEAAASVKRTEEEVAAVRVRNGLRAADGRRP